MEEPSHHSSVVVVVVFVSQLLSLWSSLFHFILKYKPTLRVGDIEGIMVYAILYDD